MDINYSKNSIKTDSIPPRFKTKILLVGTLFFVISIVSAFVGGYYLNNIVKYEQPNNASPTSISKITPSGENIIDETLITAGLEYYDDTVIAVTKTNPNKILVASVTRQENSDGAVQNTRASYFDGSVWTRKLVSNKNQTVRIDSNEIITEWKSTIDPSRVLKQTVTGNLMIDNNNLKFDTGIILNNMGIRSLPGYTKFMSNGLGTLTVNGSIVEANILYTRIYSNNSQDMQFYNTLIGLTTHWFAFWDEDGNFYHIDSTDVDKPTEKYQTHQIGVLVDKEGRVSKTFNVEINISDENPPASYQITLGLPINKNLTFNIDKSINKAPDNSYKWFLSNGTGRADNIDGYGIVEYVHY